MFFDTEVACGPNPYNLAQTIMGIILTDWVTGLQFYAEVGYVGSPDIIEGILRNEIAQQVYGWYSPAMEDIPNA